MTVPLTAPDVTTEFNLTMPTVTELAFYRETPFIVGMVILAILLLFVCLATLLCCIKPRGSKSPLEQSNLSNPVNLSPQQRRVTQPHEPVTGSWSPNDYTVSDEHT